MKNKVLICVCALLFLAGAVGSAAVLLSSEKTNVRVVSDGSVIKSFDLRMAEDQIFTVAYGESSNTIEIRDGKIRVKSGECPDKTCVHMGWLSSSAMPIVCLPNHLVIEFEDGGGVDAVAG